jgi:hippurate hydrolase
MGEGAKAMLKDGLFSKFPRPDYALAFHVKPSLQAGYVGYTKGYSAATVDSVDITVKGKGGHGAYPQNAIDPVVMASELVMSLQTIASRETSPLDPVVVTVGQIHGGTKRNVIPNEVKLELTVRTYASETRTKVLESIRRMAKGIALANGVPEELEPIVTMKKDPTPAVYNSPELVDTVLPAIREKLGDGNVVELEPVMGGEDFGRFGLQEPKTPIFMMRLGVSSKEQLSDTNNIPTLHSSYLAPIPEPTIKTGVTAMTASLLELFNQSTE